MGARRRVVLVFTLLVLLSLFGAAWWVIGTRGGTSVTLNDGTILRLYHVSAGQSQMATRSGISWQTHERLSSWGLDVRPRALLPRHGINEHNQVLWFVSSVPGRRYVGVISAPDGEFPEAHAPFLMASHAGNRLLFGTMPAFPAQEEMVVRFYKHDGGFPFNDLTNYVTKDRLLGSLTLPTPAEGRLEILTRKPFPASTNFGDVEVMVERLVYSAEVKSAKGSYIPAQATISFKEGGLVSANWDIRQGILINASGLRGNLGVKTTQPDGRRELTGSAPPDPERGWTFRGQFVRTKNFPDNELIRVDNVPLPATLEAATWRFVTNIAGVQVASTNIVSLPFTRVSRVKFRRNCLSLKK